MNILTLFLIGIILYLCYKIFRVNELFQNKIDLSNKKILLNRNLAINMNENKLEELNKLDIDLSKNNLIIDNKYNNKISIKKNLCIGNFCINKEKLKLIGGKIDAPQFYKKNGIKDSEVYYNHDCNLTTKNNKYCDINSVKDLPDKLCFNDIDQNTGSKKEKICIGPKEFDILKGKRGIKLKHIDSNKDIKNSSNDSVLEKLEKSYKGSKYIMPYYADFRATGMDIESTKDQLLFKNNHECTKTKALYIENPNFNPRKYPYYKNKQSEINCANIDCNDPLKSRQCLHKCSQHILSRENNKQSLPKKPYRIKYKFGKKGKEAFDTDLKKWKEDKIKYDKSLSNKTKLFNITLRTQIFDLLSKLKPKFLDGGESNGFEREILEKIWKDWEAFASYAFNKSHSTCYALIAYQTAYLKSHYPAEYMAAVLSNNMNDIKQVSFFMEECKRMSIKVLGPDVNESFYKFTVNDNNAIRFGMGAVKGVGSGAVKTIIEGRKEKRYNSIFDLTKTIDLRSANKKAFDSLVYAGGFDSFEGVNRAQYLQDNGDGITFIEKALKFGSKFQENKNSAQVSLFENSDEVQLQEPNIPHCDPWPNLEELKLEKEVVGIYISGHPLDDYKTPLKHFCNAPLDVLKDLNSLINKELRIGGIIGEVEHRISKNGKGWARFTVEDFTDSYDFRIFGEEYLKFKHFLFESNFIYLRLIVKEGWRNRDTGKTGDPRISFLSFQQLQDTLENNSKKLTIQLSINELDDSQLKDIKTLFKKYKGKNQLEFSFFENNEKIKLTMLSENFKVSINEELISKIKEKNLHFKLS